MATPTALSVLSSHMEAVASLGMCSQYGLPTDSAKDTVLQKYKRRVTKAEVEHLMSNLNQSTVSALRALGFIPCPVTMDNPCYFFIPSLFLKSFDDDVIVQDADGNDVSISNARLRYPAGFSCTTAFMLPNLTDIGKPVEIDFDFMGFDDGYHARE